MSRFTLPRDIYYGRGALEQLAGLTGYSRAFLVTGGRSMRSGGFLSRVEEALRKAGMEVEVYDAVEPDPSIETVQKGAERMKAFSPDLIVALGGGSPMDAAKAMWVFYEHPELTFDQIKKPFTLPPLRQKARFAAIPSTSGSASEVTAFSVITDRTRGVKYPLADFELTPDIAILDFDIPQTMPKTLVAHTGMDALTHALEAYVATARSPFSDPLAYEAVERINHSLRASYEGDASARGEMHIAQCLAGMAFSNALLGIAHALAHKIGAVFDLPHGLCNAILLPYVIQYNGRVCAGRYAKVAGAFGINTGGQDARLEALVEAVRGLNGYLSIPSSFKDAGVEQAFYAQHREQIASLAAEDPCALSNPRPTNAKALADVLDCAYKGEEITF